MAWRHESETTIIIEKTQWKKERGFKEKRDSQGSEGFELRYSEMSKIYELDSSEDIQSNKDEKTKEGQEKDHVRFECLIRI